MEEFVHLRRKLHQIPEVGFAEFKTQALLLAYLHSLPNHRLQIRPWRTGIWVKVAGLQPRKRIGFRADMDGLPISEQTEASFRSMHDGFMHACGHDMHMAIAMGILTHFVHHPIQDDLIFLFQPAEEGPGGAIPMMKSEEFTLWKPDVLFALHIGPEYPVGTIATRPGILFANSSELCIDLIGSSGHAAYPHLGNDMIIAASQLVTQLQTIISRSIDPFDTAVITIGKLTAGIKENVMAGSARLEGTIRTLSMASMDKVKRRILSIVNGIQEGFSCQATIDWGNAYCQVDNHPVITSHFMNWVQQETPYHCIECKEIMAAEDFGYFLQEIPGFMFWLGVEAVHGLHHPCIQPDERAISVGMDVMIRYIRELSQKGYPITISEVQ